MRSRFLPLAVACLAAAPALLAAAEQPSSSKVSPERIGQLIGDLGSEEYTARERASERLTEIGVPAFAALEVAAGHPDREVRYRAQRILGLIRQQDFQRRLDAFLRGEDEPGEYPLPGWKRFEKTYGRDAPARKLFVDIQRGDPQLLEALEDGPQAAADVLTGRMLQFQQALQIEQQQPSLGEVVATLFVAAEEDVDLPAPTLTMIFNLCYQPGFRDVLNSSPRRELPRQMLGTIIRRSEDFTAYQAMNVAYQYNLSEGLVPAVKVLEGQRNDRQPYMVQYALMTVARLGDKSHLPLVEKLLTDTALLTRMEENDTVYDVQVRDAALAAAVVLTKQDLRDYFDMPPQLLAFEPQTIFFNARLIGFPSEEKRAAVFAKWEKYKAESSRPAGQATGTPAADKS